MVLFLIGNDAFKNRFALLGSLDHAYTSPVLVVKGTVQGDKPLVVFGRFGIFLGAVRLGEDLFALKLPGGFDPLVFGAVGLLYQSGDSGLQYIPGKVIEIYLIGFQLCSGKRNK